jgi:predicted RNase H-like nuclease (RuvC/YqgF family)
VERARWTDERLDDRMSAIDTTFERVFEEMRAERHEFRAEMRTFRVEVRAEIHALGERIDRLEQRIDQVDGRLRQLDERLGRIGFWASGLLAAGLIALVATQL